MRVRLAVAGGGVWCGCGVAVAGFSGAGAHGCGWGWFFGAGAGAVAVAVQIKKLRSLRSLRQSFFVLQIFPPAGTVHVCCIYTWIMLAAYATCDDYPQGD